MLQTETEFVVVGSGPGGATVARQLARAGRKVLLLERGRDWRTHPLYGTYPGAMLYTNGASFLYSREGINIIRPMMLGGATSMYCGCATRPQPFWHDYGLNLDAYAEQTITELGIAPLPPEQRGRASTRLAECGSELGGAWQAQDKFFRLEMGCEMDCGAKCMLGCRCGVKWNAAAYVDNAVAAGCEVWTQARVDRVLNERGVACGVTGTRQGKPFQVNAKVVIAAAGGLGSPVLLQNSGLTQAGQGMTLDTTVIVYGHAGKEKGNGLEPPMTWSYADDELGVMYSTLVDPWLMYPIITLLKGPAYPLTWYRWGRTYGVMIKLHDEVSGKVERRGRIHKGLTPADQHKLTQATAYARRLLIKAGCNPDTIFATPARGTHPSGTVRVGEMLSPQLETEIKNLYVCDASVFPRSLARPTVLTIIALAHHLSNHLSNEDWGMGIK